MFLKWRVTLASSRYLTASAMWPSGEKPVIEVIVSLLPPWLEITSAAATPRDHLGGDRPGYCPNSASNIQSPAADWPRNVVIGPVCRPPHTMLIRFQTWAIFYCRTLLNSSLADNFWFQINWTIWNQIQNNFLKSHFHLHVYGAGCFLSLCRNTYLRWFLHKLWRPYLLLVMQNRNVITLFSRLRIIDL